MQRTAGFTLLELLVVIGVLSVLTGLSLGYLGRTDPERIANAVLAGELRAAQLTARAEGVPTEVLLRPGVDGQAATVQARLLRPVARFPFEPNQPVEDEVMRPVVQGEDVVGGRFGHARRPAGDGRAARLRWPVTPAVLDLREGFVVRLDLWLDRKAAATVLRLPPALELTLDGRVLAETVADGTPQQDAEGVFEVVPADSPIEGMVDEVRWFVYAFASPQFLPIECPLDQVHRFRFDARGEAVERPVVRFTAAAKEGS